MLLRGKNQKNAKKCGILLHLSSLPSEYGIGSLGREAYDFVDFLKNSGQSYWQMLPLTPVGKGNSPYSTISSFAGEPLYIDIRGLINDGLLSEEEVPFEEFSQNVDYKRVRDYKLPLIKKAAERFDTKSRAFEEFKKENAFWLNDYAMFSVVKRVYPKADFKDMDDGIKYRLPQSMERFYEKYKEEIERCKIIQYFFYTQYFKFKAYAGSKGIKIIGDIPFYVSLNSADVWSNPDCFRLGRDMTPVLVAGVPPDIFSQDGQLWGNPVYDWKNQKMNGYLWWKNRLKHNAKMYDIIRIDHFRAFADYYTIPFGAENAKSGEWERGPDRNFFDTVMPQISTEIIAEDLGGDTREVEKLLKYTGFPNMKILQFAFDSDLKNAFLPKNYPKNCVCYTGTHDNDTSLGWYEKATPKEKLMFSRLVPADKSNSAVLSLISYGMKSRARMVIIPLQDYLRLDSEGRMNTPGIPDGNWVWRFTEEAITEELIKTIKRLSAGRG